MFAGLLSTTLLALSLPLTALAGTHEAFHRRHHAEIAKRQEGTVGLYKRFSGMRTTFYNVETGNEVACGGRYKNTDAVVAMSLATFNKAEHCGKGLNIHFGGKTVYATLVDGCEACPPNCLDLTEGLWGQIADHALGVIAIDWEFAGGGGGGPAPPPPPPPAPAPPPPPPVVQPPPPPPAQAPPPPPPVVPAPAPSPSPPPPPAAQTTPAPSSSVSASSAAASAFPTGPSSCKKKRSLRRRQPSPQA